MRDYISKRAAGAIVSAATEQIEGEARFVVRYRDGDNSIVEILHPGRVDEQIGRYMAAGEQALADDLQAIRDDCAG